MKHLEHLENKKIPSAWDEINVESGKPSWKGRRALDRNFNYRQNLNMGKGTSRVEETESTWKVGAVYNQFCLDLVGIL